MNKVVAGLAVVMFLQIYNHDATQQGSSLPTGAIVMIDSGSCPTGFSEVAGLSTNYPLGTVAANADAGTSGGSNSYTPAGSVAAPTFTGNAGTVPAETVSWPVGVPTLSGSTGAGSSHTHTITQSAFTTTKFTTSGSGTAAYTGGGVVTSPSGAEAAHTHGVGTLAVAWPAGVPTNGTASFTPSGSNSAPAFTGTPATIQPSYYKVIFCKKS